MSVSLWPPARVSRVLCLSLGGAFGGAALCASGCVVGPALTRPSPAVADTWSNAEAASANAPDPAPTLAVWWTAFHDETLTALIERAQADNKSVASARARLGAARAQLTVARASFFPTVEASAGAGAGAQTGLAGAGAGSTTGSVTGNLGVDAAVDLDVFGGIARSVDAADAALAAAFADVDDARVAVAGNVALAYITLRQQQAERAAAARTLALQEETAALVGFRVDAGLASAAELAQANTSAAQTRAELPALDAALIASCTTLDVLLGRSPGEAQRTLLSTSTSTTTSTPNQPQAATADALAQLSVPARALARRPDLRAAEARYLAATAAVGVAEAARYPSVRLSGSLVLNAVTLAASGNALGAATSVLGSVSAPLWNAGRLAAQVDAAGANAAAARASYDAVVVGAVKDVEDNVVAARAADARTAALTEAEASAADAVALAEENYRAGLLGFQAVLDAQRTQLTVQRALAGARASSANALVHLFVALGGGVAETAPHANDSSSSSSSSSSPSSVTSTATSAGTQP